jgi:hypothetical protein
MFSPKPGGLIVVVMLCCNQISAQSIPDHFADRLLLVGDYVEAGANNITASSESGEPDHAGLSAGASLWWTWTAPATGWVTLCTTQSSFAPCFGVYRGSAITNLQSVGANSLRCNGGLDPSVSQTEIIPVHGGETYQLVFDSVRPSDEFPYLNLNTNRGDIRFSLALSTLEILSPTNGETFFTNSVSVMWLKGSQTGDVQYYSLELDGSLVPGSERNVPNSPWLLTNITQGAHILRAREHEVGGRVRYSPTIQMHVRPENDLFAEATVLTGTNFSVMGNTYYATTELDEPTHPAGDDGFSVWYRWTALADGLTRIAIPSGGGVAITVWRGNNLTNLEIVAANPTTFWLFGVDLPLYPSLQFAVRGGESYFFQVSSRYWGTPPLVPCWTCHCYEWFVGYPFSFNFSFAPGRSPRLDVELVHGMLPFPEDRLLCFFAAARGARFTLEVSSDLQRWSVLQSGVASGSIEVVGVPYDSTAEVRFLRVQLADE